MESTKLQIVTFNYDHSLEYFLLEAAMNTFRKPQEECVAKLAHIPIMHVYGLIGETTHQRAYDSRNYESLLDPASLQIAIGALKLMPKERLKDEIFEEAWKLIDASEVICFLRFGCDSVNVKRLGMPELVKRGGPGLMGHGKLIYGSVKGLVGSEVVNAATSCAALPGTFNVHNCEQTLRVHGILD